MEGDKSGRITGDFVGFCVRPFVDVTVGVEVGLFVRDMEGAQTGLDVEDVIPGEPEGFVKSVAFAGKGTEVADPDDPERFISGEATGGIGDPGDDVDGDEIGTTLDEGRATGTPAGGDNGIVFGDFEMGNVG